MILFTDSSLYNDLYMQLKVGNSALIIATRGGHLEVVKDLLTAGAIVDLKNKVGLRLQIVY